jgi:hypothetical protein
LKKKKERKKERKKEERKSISITMIQSPPRCREIPRRAFSNTRNTSDARLARSDAIRLPFVIARGAPDGSKAMQQAGRRY